MSPYTVALVVHVVVAVLGVGPIAAVALAVTSARRQGVSAARVAPALVTMLRVTRVCLGAMVATGVWMVYIAGGEYHRLLWIRASGTLTVVTFLLLWGALAALSKVVRGERDTAVALRRAESFSWSMCGTVALITFLMEAKPF